MATPKEFVASLQQCVWAPAVIVAKRATKREKNLQADYDEFIDLRREA